MGAYSKLQAVNEMLLFSGETPVNSLTASTGVDTSIAVDILDQKTLDAQARGLANNLTIRDYTIAADGRINLQNSSTIISANMLTPVESAHKDVQYARVVTKNWGSNTVPYFFNLTDNTDVFKAGTYTAELMLNIDWQEMDTPVQKEIVMQAARQYQMLTQGDGAVDNYIAQLELYYGAKARGSDVKSKGYNLFDLHQNAHKATSRNIRHDRSKSRFPNLYK